MSDVKYVASSHIAAWQNLFEQKYRFTICTKIAAAYAANLRRGHALTMVPGYSFMHGILWERCVAAAMKGMKVKDEGAHGVSQRASKILDHILGKRSEDESIASYRQSTKNVETVIKRSRILSDALRAIMESLVVQAWMAYEIMAVDLLNKAIKQRRSLDTQKNWSPFEKKNSGLGSRSKIANYYRWTFRNDNADILRAVDSTSVHALGIARNVLVHSGGRIDHKFQAHRAGFQLPGNAIKNPIPELRRIRGRRIGYRIHFTGDFVRYLVDPVTPLGFGLVKAVDEWLSTHK